MFYLIGLGLDSNSLGNQAREIISRADKIYVENYTVEFPYDLKELESSLGKEFVPADRESVESLGVLEEAKEKDVVLLVYGSPLTATTHITLLQEARKKGIDYKIIFNASVFDAVAETGLQLYKFGKIASMPEFEADSYIDLVKENKSVDSHTLILVDIGMKFSDGLERLEKDAKKKKFEVEKIVVCSKLGTKDSKVLYGDFNELKSENINAPFCFIIPGKLHFLEEEFLGSFRKH